MMTEPTRSSLPSPELRHLLSPTIDYPESTGLPLAETRIRHESPTHAAGAREACFQTRPDVVSESNARRIRVLNGAVDEGPDSGNCSRRGAAW